MQKAFIFGEILLFYIDLSLEKIYAITIFAIKKSLAVLSKICIITFAWSFASDYLFLRYFFIILENLFDCFFAFEIAGSRDS